MGEWQVMTLDNLCNFVSGSAFPKDTQGEQEGDYPFIKVSDMNLPGNERYITCANNWIGDSICQSLHAKVHPIGATIFAKIGVALTYNRRRILRQPTIIDNNMMSAIPRIAMVDGLFFYYLLRTIDFNEIAVGTALPYLNISDLKRIPVHVPSIPEQRAIAHILGTLDDKIELNRKMNQTLENMAKAIFNSWFVDFTPVRAKAEGRDTGLPKQIADLFPDSFEDSEKGEIPKGWKVGRFEDAFDLVMGQSPPGESYNEAGLGQPFYQGRTDFTFRYPKHRVYCTAPTRFAKYGDTLVSVRAPVGDINMAGENCAIGRGVAAARHKSGSRSFTFYAMSSLKSSFDAFEAGGTVFGSINKNDFHKLAFIIPSDQTVNKFEELCSPFDKTIETNEYQTRTLADLRDTLLPKFISGELLIKFPERIAKGSNNGDVV